MSKYFFGKVVVEADKLYYKHFALFDILVMHFILPQVILLIFLNAIFFITSTLK